MASIAINVLWFLIGLIVLCGIVYLAIWVIRVVRLSDPREGQAGRLGDRAAARPHCLDRYCLRGWQFSFSLRQRGASPGGTFAALSTPTAGYHKA